MTVKDNFPQFSRLLKEALADRLAANPNTFLDMVAEDVVMEFPFAPQDGTAMVSGRDQLALYLHQMAALFILDKVKLLNAFYDPKADVVILEFQGQGHSRNGTARYSQRYISVIEIREGRIQRYRDYWNPLAFTTLAAGEHR